MIDIGNIYVDVCMKLERELNMNVGLMGAKWWGHMVSSKRIFGHYRCTNCHQVSKFVVQMSPSRTTLALPKDI